MENKDKLKNAIEYLNKNFLLNMPILEALKFGAAEVLELHDYGVVARLNHGVRSDHKEHRIMLALNSDEDLKKCVHHFDSGALVVFYGNQDPSVIPSIVSGIERTTPCWQIVYTKKEPPNFVFDAEYKLLGQDFTDFVFENYSRAWNKEYIQNLLKMGLMWGAFVGGKIAGFCGRHSDGSMGLLEVMPEFRRQGLAKALESFVAKIVLDEGRTPFGHVVLGNDISVKLQSNFDGMETADRFVTFMRKELKI
ncbi:MAG: GNAT family N-acetyltransferase [Firmicutes bacterium]|nr:GNAT family N-acetyltransferase [Bacillota bacterium]